MTTTTSQPARSRGAARNRTIARRRSPAAKAANSSIVAAVDPTELLVRWRDGDGKAGAALIEALADSVRLFFINNAHARDVDDLFQKTWLAMLDAKARFRGDSSARTFVLGVARNVLLHYFRKKGRRDAPLEPLKTSVAVMLKTGVFTKFVDGWQGAKLFAALRELELEDQLLLQLFYWERLTAKECGTVLEISQTKVSSRIRRARERLARAVNNDPEPTGEDQVEDARDLWRDKIREVLGDDPVAILARHRKATDDSDGSGNDDD